MKRVGVVMGGISAEREVSMATGKEMVKYLNREKYEVYEIILNDKVQLINEVKNIDFALLALHGKFGEDGTIQGLLEALEIPYSGCNVLSSAICMDKDLTKKLLIAEGIRVASWEIIRNLDECNEKLHKINYPFVVKPNSGGSSVATAICDNYDEAYNAVKDALLFDHEVMIEEYIKGDEITCPILDDKILPTLLIKSPSEFFDYKAKYSDKEHGGADEIPIKLDEELQREIVNITLKTWKAVKGSVYGRVDFILKDKVPYFLEINTLPGMTANSLIPKSARAAGISYSELLDKIIEVSLLKDK